VAKVVYDEAYPDPVAVTLLAEAGVSSLPIAGAAR